MPLALMLAWSAEKACAAAMVTEEVESLSGLGASATAEFDASGVPTISAKNLEDAVRAQGFVHARDRYFQMDMTRRFAAGRMAELVGPAALGYDRANRRYRLAAVAERVLHDLPAEHRAILAAYTEGVNAGLRSMPAPPPEYGFIWSRPQEWQERDCILVMLSMFRTLSLGDRFERSRHVMRTALNSSLEAFLTPETERFDAPHAAQGEPSDYAPAAIPGPEVIDLRADARDVENAYAVDVLVRREDDLRGMGSNNWAIAGSRTADGRAILANDMHLVLNVPNTWYRVRMRWGDADEQKQVCGVSLPGVPLIAAGSNTHLAWGFTNVTGDFEDFIIVEPDPQDPQRYLTPEGSEAFTEEREEILIRGAPSEPITLRVTRWGAVIDRDFAGRDLVLKWIAFEPGCVNIALLDLAHARTLEEGVQVARRWYGPPQNVLLASSDGRIAWVMSGWIPRRRGFDGTVPVSWARGDVSWAGKLDEADRPVLIDPPSGMLFTANNRTLPLEQARLIGRHWASGVRARRIAELLSAKTVLDERDLLAIQLDTRAGMYDFYRDLALEVTEHASAEARGPDADRLLLEAKGIIRRWDGTASADEPGYLLLRDFQMRLAGAVLRPLLAPCTKLDRGFRYYWWLDEEPVRRILEERPQHLIPPPYTSWEALIARVWIDTLTDIDARFPDRGLQTPWGEANRAEIQHPLSIAVPALSRLLDMPRDPLPGDFSTVRVSSHAFGASERMVVSPGREVNGVFHMPAGQSGHFLSPHYADGHEAWVHGRDTPFLPGTAVRLIRFEP